MGYIKICDRDYTKISALQPGHILYLDKSQAYFPFGKTSFQEHEIVVAFWSKRSCRLSSICFRRQVFETPDRYILQVLHFFRRDGFHDYNLHAIFSALYRLHYQFFHRQTNKFFPNITNINYAK